MAYQLRLYAPTGSGITSLTVKNTSGTVLGTATPAGTSTACFNQSGLTTGVTITPTLESGVSVSQWVVNVDGSRYYQYTTTCSIGYDSSVSNIQIRLEVEGTPTTTYYATLSFNANGGSGAPSTLYGSSTDGTGYVVFSIPSTTPTRSGYAFAGWATNSSGTGTIRYPGGTYTGYGTTSYPGASHTLYAVWEQASYEVTIIYDANGGSGAPSSEKYTGTSQSLTVTLSSTTPTKSGYVFAGWATTSTATTAQYSAGQTLSNVYAGSSGYTWTLYAVWSEEKSGYVYIYSGGWKKAIPYVYSDGWKQAVPYVYSSGWKKTT